MKNTINQENLMAICGQNQRSQETNSLAFTHEILNKIRNNEPELHQFIIGTAESTAEDFVGRYDEILGEPANEVEAAITEKQLLSVMFAHCMAMVAGAFISRDETKELEDMLG